MRAIVAGGGIGGLTAALALHEADIDVVVLEATREVRPLGVGINLLPHATRELAELGVGGALAATGIPTGRLAYFDRFGTPIWSEPRGLAAGYDWPQWSIHRGELQLLLLAAVERRLGTAAVQPARRVEGVETAPDEVRAEIRDVVSGRLSEERADVLVAADGIHSAVRAQLVPGEGPPLWNGVRMWRAVTETEPFLDGRTMVMAGSNLAAKFVAYPISAPHEGAGTALVNWVAEVREPGSATATSEADWEKFGSLDEAVQHFADWTFDWLDVPSLMRNAGQVWEYPMVDRDPLDRWTHGRVTLLGDAAHPMYPIGSNGASQAIIDARVLAWSLHHHHDDPSAGLLAYEEARRVAVNAVVLANRAMGPERVLALVAQRAPEGFDRIEDVLRPQELEEIASSYKRSAGFDADELRARPSWSTSAELTRPRRSPPIEDR